MDTYRRSGIVRGILFIASTAAGAGIAISMYSILRRHNEGVAPMAAGLRILEGVFDGIGTVLILLLATLSRGFIKAGPTDLEQFQSLGAHLYYSLFFKTWMVPRWLSAWGLAGITLTAAAGILVLFRQIAPLSTAQLLMNLPIAPQVIVLAIWLIVKGFDPSASASPQRLQRLGAAAKSS